MNDPRFDVTYIAKVLMPDGSRQPVSSTPHVYFFDGKAVTIFPVKMTEDDITELHGHFQAMTNYHQMIPLLRQYEVAGP
jgi:hypothetical protein